MRSKSSKTQTLSSFCQKDSSLRTKIALRTFYKVRYPVWKEKLILFVEHIQLMSQMILSCSFSYESSQNLPFIFQGIVYALKLINPSYLLDFDTSRSVISAIIAIISLAFTLLKWMLFAHTIHNSLRNREMNIYLQSLWRWIYKLQTRILYFLISSFWILIIIEARDHNFTLFGMDKGFTISISIILIILEFLFSLVLDTQLCYFLPSKSFLSSKNNHLQIITFLQKFFIQILMLCFKHESKALTWLILTLCVILDTTRFYKFFYTLPLHSTEALTLQGGLQSAVISCSLAKFINTALKSNDYEGAGLSFVIILWILFSLFTSKISFEILKSQALSLLNKNNKASFPEKLLHKVILSDELRKNQRIPASETSQYKLDHLVLIHQNANIEEIFGVGLSLMENNINPHEDDDEKIDRASLIFYQKLLFQYPKNSLLRLYVAHQSYKNCEPYAKTFQILNGMQTKKLSQNYLTCSLLLHDIEKSIANSQKESLDLQTFLKSEILVEDVKSSILKQTDLQMKVCKTMLSNIPNIGNIHRFAQSIHHYKRLIKKKIDNLSNTLPEYHAFPYLWLAEYHLIANYSIFDFEKYYEIYAQRFSKTQKFFREPELIQENLYQNSNAFLLISIQNHGEILFHTKSLENICGWDYTKESHKRSVLSLFPLSLQEYYKNIFRQIDQEGFLNKIHQTYLNNKGGFLVEADVRIKYHPYLNQGLCLNMIVRPVPVITKDADFLLLNENGEIEGASQGLTKILNLSLDSTKVHIENISEELFTANNAFQRILQGEVEMKPKSLSKESPPKRARPRSRTKNSVHQSKPPQIKMNYENASQIWSAFTSEEQEIKISPPAQNFLKFYARIETQRYDHIRINLVRLQAISNIPQNQNLESKEVEADFQPQLDTETPFIMSSTTRNLKKNNTETNSEFPGASRKGNIEHFRVGHLNSHIQKSSEENKAYMRSISSKSYPKSFKLLCFAFYLIILVNFAGQIIMKSVSNETMSNLQIRKNLLEYAQQRAYKGALIQINAIGARSQVQGVFTGGSGTVGSVAGVIAALQIRVQDMKVANDMMLKSVYSLDKETQGRLFSADIRVNGTFSVNDDAIYQYVNIFQLTQEVANAVVALKHLPTAYSILGYNIFDYLSKNLINDFLYKSSEIYELLSTVVRKQKESFQNVTRLFFAISPLLLAGIGLLLIFIIWSQSRIEKQNMKAVIKIPPKGVKAIAKRLARFREDLMNEDSFEKKWRPSSSSNETQDLQNLSNVETSFYSKEAETKEIQYKQFRKRYAGYIARVFLCILALVVIIIWDMIQTNHSINIIYNRQNQLEFANYISDRATLLFATMNPLFYTNNTMLVNHKLPNETLLSAWQEIKEIQSQVSQKFLEVDGTYNPKVWRILFENNQECKGFVPSFLVYCKYLVSIGQPVYMVTSLAAYQEGVQGKYHDYLNANKSSLATISTSALLNINMVLANFGVISQEAQMIVNITDASMGQEISEMQKSKDRIIGIFSISLLIVSLLIWFSILKFIREVHNDFKKVLQLFPSYLVLSSYLLNKFLKDTSSS